MSSVTLGERMALRDQLMGSCMKVGMICRDDGSRAVVLANCLDWSA